jgi:hypothetical protein
MNKPISWINRKVFTYCFCCFSILSLSGWYLATMTSFETVAYALASNGTRMLIQIPKSMNRLAFVLIDSIFDDYSACTRSCHSHNPIQAKPMCKTSPSSDISMRFNNRDRIAPKVTTHAEPTGRILIRRDAIPNKSQPTGSNNRDKNTPPANKDHPNGSKYWTAFIVSPLI